MDQFSINYSRTADQSSSPEYPDPQSTLDGRRPLVTTLMAMVTVSPAILNAVFSSRLLFYGLIIGELGRWSHLRRHQQAERHLASCVRPPPPERHYRIIISPSTPPNQFVPPSSSAATSALAPSATGERD
jgi:hypothetical protein